MHIKVISEDAPAIPGAREPIIEPKSLEFGQLKCWSTGDNVKYFPSGKSVSMLPPGVYEINLDYNRGNYFKKINVKTEGLLRFPDTNSDIIVDEIKRFWDSEELYRRFSLSYKRGMLLYGPPGSGKSSTLQLVIADVVSRGGLVLKYNCATSLFMDGVGMLREIQPDTPLLVLFEDIDSLIQQYPESNILNIIDGVDSIDKVVFLATTNYPEQLGERIINRPSRFDRRFKMSHPNKLCRMIYFEHLFNDELIKKHKIDIDKWVKDTEGFSIAHLKEMFVSVCILGNSYKSVLRHLKEMNEEHVSSAEDEQIGFKI